MPTIAIAILTAAFTILAPVSIAINLYLRARNHGRLPSAAAQATIAFALAAAGHNGVLVYRVVTGSDGVTGAGIVLALWSPLAACAMWIALGKHRVRVYPARRRTAAAAAGSASVSAADIVPAAAADSLVAGRVPAVPRGLPFDRTAAMAAPMTPHDPVSLPAGRDDPTPDQPCAAPLRASRLPPTIRDLVRAEGVAAARTTLRDAVLPDRRIPARALAEAARSARAAAPGAPADMFAAPDAAPGATWPAVYQGAWPPPLPEVWSDPNRGAWVAAAASAAAPGAIPGAIGGTLPVDALS
jgi:hypothetical protein